MPKYNDFELDVQITKDKDEVDAVTKKMQAVICAMSNSCEEPD